MRTTLFATLALAAIVAGSTVARADEFAGQHQTPNGSGAYLDQQATDSQLSDPTAPNSIRSHGNH